MRRGWVGYNGDGNYGALHNIGGEEDGDGNLNDDNLGVEFLMPFNEGNGAAYQDGRSTSRSMYDMAPPNSSQQPQARAPEPRRKRSSTTMIGGKAKEVKSNGIRISETREPRKKRSFTTYAKDAPVDENAAKLQRIDNERRALTQSIARVLDKRALEQVVVEAALRDPSIMSDMITMHGRLQEDMDADDEDGLEHEVEREEEEGEGNGNYGMGRHARVNGSGRRSMVDVFETVKTAEPKRRSTINSSEVAKISKIAEPKRRTTIFSPEDAKPSKTAEPEPKRRSTINSSEVKTAKTAEPKRRTTINSSEFKTEEHSGDSHGFTNNLPGFKFKYSESKPTPTGVDDAEWDKIYICANSRMYSKHFNNDITPTIKARHDGRTYKLALEILEERRAKHPENEMLGVRDGKQSTSLQSSSHELQPKKMPLQPLWAKKTHSKENIKPNGTSKSMPPPRNMRPQSTKQETPIPGQPTRRASNIGHRFQYEEAAPSPQGIDDADWDIAYVAANGRILGSFGEQKARKHRQDGQTANLAMQIIQRESGGKYSNGKTPATSDPKPATKSSPVKQESNTVKKPRAVPRTFDQPASFGKPPHISGEEWKRIFSKANSRIYYNNHGIWGTYRKSAEHAGDLRERGETLRVALQIVEEEKEKAEKEPKNLLQRR